MPRKRKLSLNDIGSLPVTPVNRSTHITNLRDFQKQYDPDEKAKAEAPTRKIVAETQAKVSAVLAEHSARVAKFWRLPIASIEDYIRYSDEVVDDRIDLPTTETPISNEKFSEVLKTFVESLPSRGVELLTQESRRRFALYACSQRDSRQAVIDDATLTAMLERCLTLKIFGSEVTGELARAEIKQEQVQPKAATWSAVEDLNPENREQKKLIERALGEDFTSEIAAFFDLWREQLQRDYGYTIPDNLIKRALQYVTDANMNPLRHETWNIVRRVFVKNGWFPAGMLTGREKLSELCETQDISNRDVRRAINLKNRELLESEPAYAPHK
jgi:hypothetical protein